PAATGRRPPLRTTVAQSAPTLPGAGADVVRGHRSCDRVHMIVTSRLHSLLGAPVDDACATPARGGDPFMSRPLQRRRTRRGAITVGSAAALLAATMVPISGATADPADVTDLGSADELGASAVTDAFMPSASSPTGAWFVQLEGEPTTQGGNEAAIASSQEQLEQ